MLKFIHLTIKDAIWILSFKKTSWPQTITNLIYLVKALAFKACNEVTPMNLSFRNGFIQQISRENLVHSNIWTYSKNENNRW